MENAHQRVGNITSSDAIELLGVNRKGEWPGDTAITYINEKIMERRLGISLETEVDAKPLNWGKFLEPRVHKILGDEYTSYSNTSIFHPKYPYWCGRPDAVKSKTVAEIKCPFTRKSFIQLVQPMYDGLEGIDCMNAIRKGYTAKNGLFVKPNKEAEKYYQQIVSSACITEATHGEFIVYMPYESDLADIKNDADGDPNGYFIWAAKERELPYLKDGGYYHSFNKLLFEIPQADKDLLEMRVRQAGVYFENI